MVLRPVWDESIPLEMVYVNKSIWANQITGVFNDKILFKNIEVDVKSSEDNIPNMSDLIKKIKES